MGKIGNPVKKKKYAIEINGYDQAHAQKVTIGKVEITVAEHGDGLLTIGTPNGVKYPDVVIEGLTAEDIGDRFFWDKLNAAANGDTGETGLQEDYEFTYFIKLLDGRGGVVRRWQLKGWVKGVEPDPLGDKEDGNYMEKATLHTNGFKLVK